MPNDKISCSRDGDGKDKTSTIANQQANSTNSNNQAQETIVQEIASDKRSTMALTTNLEYLNNLEFSEFTQGINHLISLSVSEGYLLVKRTTNRTKDKTVNKQQLKCKFHRLSKRKRNDGNSVPCLYRISIGRGIRGQKVFKVNVSNCAHNYPSLLDNDKKQIIDNYNISVLNEQQSNIVDINNQPQETNSLVATNNDGQSEHIATNKDPLNSLEFTDMIKGMDHIISLGLKKGYLSDKKIVTEEKITHLLIKH